MIQEIYLNVNEEFQSPQNQLTGCHFPSTTASLMNFFSLFCHIKVVHDTHNRAQNNASTKYISCRKITCNSTTSTQSFMTHL